MSNNLLKDHASTDAGHWLRVYYLVRAMVSLAWVAAVLTVGSKSAFVAGALLLIYPAWDALANVVDARKNGGLRRNSSQAFNTAVSSLATVAVAFGLAASMNVVLGIFGVWATLSGLLQLATAVRRWKHVGAQWAMILSGAQSAIVGVTFFWKAVGPTTPNAADIAPYAAFGAFYFLVSAIWLSVSRARQRRLDAREEAS
ncbi:DUF308 domain-containing protein [Mycobacterium sp. E796]|uniref:DUF308 domain-containing protein n=1 Tax=Mycobacterium sp. E796 TaxID=1834151 RepID=UPI0008002648|nr:DUF308 domain-containing protein [Mycobacterium sp. E796]OBI44088.1 hypothetical protein A5706_04470 [Mycobacterium sp. E796]